MNRCRGRTRGTASTSRAGLLDNRNAATASPCGRVIRRSRCRLGFVHQHSTCQGVSGSHGAVPRWIPALSTVVKIARPDLDPAIRLWTVRRPRCAPPQRRHVASNRSSAGRGEGWAARSSPRGLSAVGLQLGGCRSFLTSGRQKNRRRQGDCRGPSTRVDGNTGCQAMAVGGSKGPPRIERTGPNRPDVSVPAAWLESRTVRGGIPGWRRMR